MKMVHGNAVFIREEAKLARNNHRYTSSTSLTSLSINRWLQEISFSPDYNGKLGGVAWYLCEVEASRFLNN